MLIFFSANVVSKSKGSALTSSAWNSAIISFILSWLDSATATDQLPWHAGPCCIRSLALATVTPTRNAIRTKITPRVGKSERLRDALAAIAASNPVHDPMILVLEGSGYLEVACT